MNALIEFAAYAAEWLVSTGLQVGIVAGLALACHRLVR